MLPHAVLGGEFVGSLKLPTYESFHFPGLGGCDSQGMKSRAKTSLGISPRDKSPFTETSIPEQQSEVSDHIMVRLTKIAELQVLPPPTFGGQDGLFFVGWVGGKERIYRRASSGSLLRSLCVKAPPQGMVRDNFLLCPYLLVLVHVYGEVGLHIA